MESSIRKTMNGSFYSEIRFFHSEFDTFNTPTTDSQHEAISTKTNENDWSLKNT